MGVQRRRRRKGAKARPQRFPLKELLQARGLSQLELVRRTGIGQNRVQAIHAGRVCPTWTTILRIATALDVDLGELWSPPKRGGAA